MRIFLNRYDVEQLRFLVQCMKVTSKTSWVQYTAKVDSDKAAQEYDAGASSQEAVVISEIMDLLQLLDLRSLKKMKDIIQVAFFD